MLTGENRLMAYSSVVEHLIVNQDVAGSSPVMPVPTGLNPLLQWDVVDLDANLVFYYPFPRSKSCECVSKAQWGLFEKRYGGGWYIRS